MAPLSTQPDPFSVITGDFDLLPAFQNAVPLPGTENSGRYLEPELSETFSHGTTIALFNYSPIGEDDVPISADCSQGIELAEPEPNVFKFFETNQGIQFNGRCYLRANR